MPQDETINGVRIKWENDEATVLSETGEIWGTIRYTPGVPQSYLVTTPGHSKAHTFATTVFAVTWLRGYAAGFDDAEATFS